jgi:hypothetical protein
MLFDRWTGTIRTGTILRSYSASSPLKLRYNVLVTEIAPDSSLPFTDGPFDSQVLVNAPNLELVHICIFLAFAFESKRW